MTPTRGQPRLREAEITDAAGVARLMKSVGLGPSNTNLTGPGTPDADGAEQQLTDQWLRLWHRNPAVAGPEGTSAGWLLDVDDEVVGFFGSIPMRYRLGDRRLRVAVATGWCVAPDHRSHTKLLAKAYFTQDADLLLSTTTSRPAERIFRRSARRVPLPDYQRPLFWVVDADGFAMALARRAAVPERVAGLLARIGAPVLALDRSIRRRRPGRRLSGLRTNRRELHDFDDAFDDLWERATRSSNRLLASRSAQDLRWHYETVAGREGTHLITCHSGGRLVGYAILLSAHVPKAGLLRTRVADLLVDGDDVTVVDAILAAAHEIARASGVAVLEVVGLPPTIRRHIRASRPYSRRLPDFPLYYTTSDATLSARLEDPSAWYVTLYDGDATLA